MGVTDCAIERRTSRILPRCPRTYDYRTAFGRLSRQSAAPGRVSDRRSLNGRVTTIP